MGDILNDNGLNQAELDAFVRKTSKPNSDILARNGLTEQELKDFVAKQNNSNYQRELYNKASKVSELESLVISPLYSAGNLLYKGKLESEKLLNKLSPSLVSDSEIKKTEKTLAGAKDAYYAIKNSQGSATQAGMDIGEFIPFALGGEVAVPAKVASSAAKAADELIKGGGLVAKYGKSALSRAPQNLLTGALYGEGNNKGVESSALSMAALSPLFEAGFSSIGKLLSKFSDKTGMKSFDIITKYRGMLSDAKPDTNDVPESKLLSDIKAGYEGAKQDAAKAYEQAIRESDRDSKQFEYKNISDKARSEIDKIANTYGIKKVNFGNLDKSSIPPQAKDALREIRPFLNKEKSSFQAADDFRKIIRSMTKSSNPILSNAMRELKAGIDKDFDENDSSSLWKSARKKYSSLKSLEKNPVIKNYVISDNPKESYKLFNEFLKQGKNMDEIFSMLSGDGKKSLEYGALRDLAGFNADDGVNINKLLNNYSKIPEARKKAIFSDRTRSYMSDLFKDRRVNKKAFKQALDLEKDPNALNKLASDEFLGNIASIGLGGVAAKLSGIPLIDGASIGKMLLGTRNTTSKKLVNALSGDGDEVDKELEKLAKKVAKNNARKMAVKSIYQRPIKGFPSNLLAAGSINLLGGLKDAQ